MAEFRQKKVQSMLQKEIGSLILSGKIKDPRINSFLSVNSVKVSKDNAYAKIYISSLNSGKTLDKSVDALNHAAGYIQVLIGKKLTMRHTPKLTFFADRSVKHGFEMIRKIEELGV